MNRFEKRKLPIKLHIAIFLPLVAFMILLILFLQGIHSIENTTKAKQQESLETAIARSISQCYAVEGAYPPSIAYLEEHYGITYDSDHFLVDYEYYGNNLLPEVTVLPKQK